MRRACVHVGTHKTGSTALQVFLAMNRPELAGAGICYPKTGRIEYAEGTATPGHHALAHELADAGVGPVLRAVLEEIAASGSATAVLSSEEFSILCARPERLAVLRDALAGIGFAPSAAVYLRPQPYYAESVFAEMLKGAYLTDIDAYFAAVLRDGFFTPPEALRVMTFDYPALVDQLEGVFGAGNVAVRAYRPDLGDNAILTDFLGVVASLHGSLGVTSLRNPMPHANESLTLRGLISALANVAKADIVVRDFTDAELDSRFQLLRYAEAAAFFERFREGNAAINERYGIAIPFARDEDAPRPDDPRFARADAQRALLGRIIADLGLLSKR